MSADSSVKPNGTRNGIDSAVPPSGECAGWFGLRTRCPRGLPGKSKPVSGKNGIDHSFSGVSNTDRKLPPGGAAMLAVVIVAALSFAVVIGYILYLTPGPNDQI
jgi:hypothetical protein